MSFSSRSKTTHRLTRNNALLLAFSFDVSSCAVSSLLVRDAMLTVPTLAGLDGEPPEPPLPYGEAMTGMRGGPSTGAAAPAPLVAIKRKRPLQLQWSYALCCCSYLIRPCIVLTVAGQARVH